jgi:PAS domain S-box-containing protein
VLALFDVDVARRQAQDVRHARDFARAVQDAVQYPMLVVDDEHRVQSMNRAFAEAFELSPSKAEGRDVFSVGAPKPLLGRARGELERLLRSSTPFDDVEVDAGDGSDPTRRLRVSGRRIETAGDGRSFTLLAIAPAPAGRGAVE